MARVTTPYPPRLMTKARAAEYCSMGPDLWQSTIGTMVTPIQYSKGVTLYDRLQIDRVVDLKTGMANDDDPSLKALGR